jgi:uroporphyrinogen-III synthase
MLPAPAQGAIGIECRSDDEATTSLLRSIDHGETHLAVLAERAFTRALGGTCHSPIAASAMTDGGEIDFACELLSEDGAEHMVRTTRFPVGDVRGRMRRLLLLRPEPGLSASAERARALGLDVLCCPLFRVEPLDWEAPDTMQYDALLLTSANSVRHAGPNLLRLAALPVHAVGQTTAAAARDRGLKVETVGSGNVSDLLSALPSSLRLLHLAGEDHRPVFDDRIDRRIIYRSVPISEPPLPPLNGLVIAVHSPRSGMRLSELSNERGAAIVAAISDAAAVACGEGWERIAVAAEPNDKSLLALAASLCHKSYQ